MIRLSPFTKFLFFLGLFFFTANSAFSQADWNWKYFNPKNQPWTILAPGPMRPDAEAQNPGGNKGSYTYNDFFGFFAVIYRDSPRRFLPWKPDYGSYMENVRDDVVKANNGQLISDVEFKNRNVTGREVLVKFPSGTTRSIEGQTVTKYRVQRFRTFFLGRRFYILLAVLPESEVNTPMINRFFDSFVVNTAPVASGNTYTIDEDGTLSIGATNGILSNDADAEQKSLTVSNSRPLTAPANGELALNADGSFTYKPKPDFNGRDSFTYQASDGIVDSNVATVNINIAPINDAPIISSVPSTNKIDELTQFRFTVSANDVDSPSNSLRYSLSDAPSGATIDPRTGVFNWTPTEAQGPGTFNIRFAVSDGQASASSVTSVTVREVNVAPQFSTSSVSATVNELEPYNLTVSALDADVPVQTLTYSLLNAPSGVSINSSTGRLIWTPTEAQGDNSTYNFTVRVSDGLSNADASVKLTVKEINSAPILETLADLTIDELKPLTVTARATDADQPANNLSYSLEGNIPAGMTIDGRNGLVSWTPNESQGPSDATVTVRATDNGSPSLSDVKTFRIRINEVNQAPRADNVSVIVDEDNSVSFSLRGSDADLPANTLGFQIISNPQHGKLSGANSNLTYTPNPDFNGSDSFTFKINDGALDSNAATVTINIRPINDMPIARPDNSETSINTAIEIDVIANDSDADQDSLILSGISNAVNGQAVITNNRVRFTPDSQFQGTASFSYTVSDNRGGSTTSTVTIRVNPPRPNN